MTHMGIETKWGTMGIRYREVLNDLGIEGPALRHSTSFFIFVGLPVQMKRFVGRLVSEFLVEDHQVVFVKVNPLDPQGWSLLNSGLGLVGSV